MNQADLIDAARTAIKGSEAEVARRIEISGPVLNRLKKGLQPMPDRVAKRLAELAGLDPATVVAEIEAAKAGREMQGVWKEIARRASRAAVLLLAVGLLVGLVPHPAGAWAKGGRTENVYYVN